VCLGAMHYHGMAGMERDPRKAFEVYNLAAERGQFSWILLEATCSRQLLLFVLILLPLHCRHFILNCLIGSLEAWRNLAAMYFTGDGIPKSEETAKEIMRVMFSDENK
jgi:TPR repeat protein